MSMLMIRDGAMNLGRSVHKHSGPGALSPPSPGFSPALNQGKQPETVDTLGHTALKIELAFSAVVPCKLVPASLKNC